MSEDNIVIFGNNTNEEVHCLCVNPEDEETALILMQGEEKTDIIPEYLTCKINNIIRCCNKIISNEDLEYYSPVRLAFTDLFYRVRHEFLFKAVCITLGIDQSLTDISFEKFGIESKRTPDYIGYRNDWLCIIEVTATSSFEKGSQQKGLESAGFESKYRKEIDMLIAKGEKVKYIPIIFEMSNIGSDEYKAIIHECLEVFPNLDINMSILDYVSKEFKIMTMNMKEGLNAPSSLLFSKPIIIPEDHDEIKFIYKKPLPGEKKPNYLNYIEKKISPKVYTKIINTWDTLLYKLNRLKDDKNYKLTINMITNRVYFESFRSGLNKTEWFNMINNKNKNEVFENTVLDFNGDYKPCIGSDTGYTFIVTNREGDSVFKGKGVNMLKGKTAGHDELTISRGGFDFTYYQEIGDLNNEQTLIPVYYDEDYENKFLDSICDLDRICYKEDKEEYLINSEPKFLGENKLTNYKIEEVMATMSKNYIEKNRMDDNLPLKKRKMKSPFILPFAEINQSNYTTYKFKNHSFINAVLKEISGSNPFTSLILQKCLADDYRFGEDGNQPSVFLNGLMNRRSEINRQMTQIYKKVVRGLNLKVSVKMADTPESEDKDEYLKLRDELPELNKTILEQQKIENIKRNISMIRLKTKNIKKTKDNPHPSENFLTSLYKKEMEHFKDRTKQSTIEGVGIIGSIDTDYKLCKGLVNQVIDLLPMNCGYNPDTLVDLQSYEDCTLLKECKDHAIETYKDLVESVRSSYLGHASALVSRMAHSLLFYSQLPFNSDYIRVDNLGYKDVLLIVKGGKKIFKTKSSKLYRMVYPVSPKVLAMYINNSIGPSSYTAFQMNGKNYLVTPWMLMHESILNDSLSFYSRVTSFVILNNDPKLSYETQYKNTAINVLLAFHNRRQTESLLANLRYILLSTIGEYSSFSGILVEFVGFNYDLFQNYIRSSIIMNYPGYFRNIAVLNNSNLKENSVDLKKSCIKNIFTEEYIKHVDDLALMIYSTFLMTKAPYQRNVERANNLKGMLKIHEEFDNKVGLKLNPKEQFEKLNVELKGDAEGYVEEVFENDFKFDAKLLTQIGIFANSYFKERGLTERIFTSWNRILNENWDSMATSTGLRGNIKDTENFWGKKGYYIVYNEVTSDPKYLEDIKDMLKDQNLSDDEKRRRLRRLNQTFQDKMKESYEILIFHAVDKTQWRGGREIFVMDTDTKKSQQPIEKFMGELCKMLDNELISIPSDRRAQTIHHAIFERDLPLKDAITYYLTLDCSKWAPKSIFIKFCLLLIPMSVIPNSFKTHFMNYISKLYYKRIYFNVSEVEVLKNNPNYSDSINKYLIKDDNVRGYYMLMPYSWVMGIFNYTSSFLHALNQKYMSYVISQTSLTSFNEETTLVMFAHSDDSGGRISSSNKKLIQRGLIIYEIGLKSCNHLLSRKKCTVSKFYFEILSVIYMFKKLLALLPKFLGGIRFLPTDKGMAQDMLQSYSKCIEVMVAGADFSIAYMVQKIYSMLVWKFYINRPPTKNDYCRPVQYLGMPDAHPITTLISGSDSDIIRILYTKGEDYLSKLISLSSNIFNTFDDEGPVRSIKFQIQIRNAVKGFESQIETFKEEISCWSIKNVNFKTTPFSLMNFLSKLNDPGFVGSLMNESPIRRISRSYFLRIGLSVITKYGPKTLKFAMDTLSAICMVASGDLTLEMLSKEALTFENYTEFQQEITDLTSKAMNNLQVFKIASYNSLKIYKYFDQITLKNKNFMNTNRTLKPTHLEIIKTNKGFSVDFQPAQLVSYVKDENFRWALPNVNNLMGAKIELDRLLDVHNLDINNIDHSTLLKLINMFTGKSVKDIYLYSRVPSEIRSMRTYSSLLSFLSVNTQKGKEISGLVLKLQSDLTDPGYLPLMIDEETYVLNTFLVSSLIISKIYGWNFMSKLTINKNKLFNPEDCNFIEFLDWISKNYLGNHFLSALNPTIQYIKQKIEWPNRPPTGSIFKDGSFYTFTKSQKLSSGWYGKGEVAIFCNGNFYKFELMNNAVVNCTTNFEGKLDKESCDFIIDVLTSNDIFIQPKGFKTQGEIRTDYSFGYDYSGELRVSNKREVKTGVECYFKSSIGGDLAHLENFYVEHIDDNNYLLSYRSGEMKQRIKIKTIKILKGEILNTLRMLLQPEGFKEKLIESGLDDFDDFLLTEVLTEFGGENYINFNDFIDNCQSSRLYEIMKWEQDNEIEPDNLIDFGTMPGTAGSLAFGFLKYGETTGDWIIKQPKIISRAIMNLRSEYPENFTLILNEKLLESYNSMYNSEEKIEIRQAYSDLLGLGSQEEVRKKVIELMCYWGYSSLVNTIRCFSASQKEENYEIFRITGYDLKDERIYSQLFITLLKAINKGFMSFHHVYRRLNYPVKRLAPGRGGLEEVVVNNIKGVITSLYKYTTALCSVELYTCKFLNCLKALFNEPDFLELLHNELKDEYPLSLIPVNEKNVVNFIVTYNTLKVIWSKTNKVDYALDVAKMVERLPNNVPNPFKFYKEITDLVTPADIYFHGYLNREFVNKIKGAEDNFKYKSNWYLIRNKLSGYSEFSVPIIKGMEVISPLNEEVFEDPNWEDIIYESEMTEIDYDTIIELWEEIEDKYAEVQTVIEDGSVEAEINWIIDVGCESALFKESKIRQVGEFIVLLTTRVNILSDLDGVIIKEMYLDTHGKYKSNLLAYIILPQGVDPDLADKLFGKNNFQLDYNTTKTLDPQSVRTPEGIQGSTYIGKLFSEMGAGNQEEEIIEESASDIKIREMNRLKKEIKDIVDEAIIENPDCKEVYERILKKYISNLEKGFSLANDGLMESLLMELDLNEINGKVTSGEGIDFSKEQVISMHLSPSHFGMAKGKSSSKPVDFKDKKAKAELESLKPGLAEKIVSGSLTISPKYVKIIKANMDIWKVYVDNTSYKQESKKFLWNLLRKICIDSTKVETNEDDEVWKEVIDKCVTTLAEDKEDSINKGKSTFKLSLRQGARLKYRHKGL